MNRFCLVVLSSGRTLEGYTPVHGERDTSHFACSLGILCEQLGLAADTEILADDNWKVQDLPSSILENKPKFGFSIAAPEFYQHQLQSQAENPLEVFGETKWHNISSDKHVLSQLQDVLHVMTKEKSMSMSGQACQPRDEQSDVEHLADQLHQLADFLHVSDGVPLNVYWIVAGNTPDIRLYLPLFGALKRLQDWHGAYVTPVCNPQFDRDSFEKSWGKFLSLSITNVASLEPLSRAHLESVWHGCIVFEKTNSRLVLPGFKLLLDERRPRGSSLKAEVRLENSQCKKSCYSGHVAALPGCELQILDIVEKSSVLLYMFLPLKLKLHIHSSSQKMSNQFMNWFSLENNAEVAVIGCLSFESTSSENLKHKNREAWISHIKSSGSSSKAAGSCAVGMSSMSRLCMLCADGKGGIDVFMLRPPEQLDGRILDNLAVISSSCNIAVDSCKGSFCFPDLTDSLPTRESLLLQNQLQLIQGELERRSAKETGNPEMLCSELTELITSTRLQSIKELREKSVGLNAQQSRQLNAPSDTVIQAKSEFSLSPSCWPERLWLRQNESPAKKDEKSETNEAAKSVSSFDIREILKKFKSDGKPVRDDLSPVMAAGGGASEGHVRINTSFNVIRRATYPDALQCRFHGVEYCLDTCDALKKDTELTNLQNSVIKLETLSTCVETVSKIHKPSTQPRVRSGGMSTRQKSKPTRITRKRPLGTNKAVKQRGVHQTRTSSSKSTKRKRKNTEDEDKEGKLEDLADRKSQETRSQRHQRRLKRVVDAALKDNGVDHTHNLHKSCSERLYRVCKSFLKDLSSSHGLNEEMKRLAKSNVEQVIAFESKRLEKKRDKD